MLDYLRNLTKSEEEKREEMLSAYVDGSLTPKEQRRVESELAQNERLAARVDEMRLLRQQMRRLPQRKVRRNFSLDPALYGRPQREPLVQAYPILRTATALAAFIFIFLVAANLFLGGLGFAPPPAEAPLMQTAVEEEEAVAAAPAAPTAITRVVTEVQEVIVTPVEEEAEAETFMAQEQPMEEEAVEESQPLAEVGVEPDFDQSEEDASAAFQESEAAVEEQVPLEDGERVQQPEALSSPQGEAASPLPTMVAETTATAAQAAELPPAVLTEPAQAVEQPALPAEAPLQSQSSSLMSGLWLVSILVGVALLVLVVLTLLARRRL